MTNPNLVNTSQVFMRSNIQLPLSTSITDILEAPTSSNMIIRADTVTICNTTASAISADVYLTRNSTTYAIAKTIEVPAHSSMVVIDKDYPIYLEEGDKLQVQASSWGLQVICPYTVISDTSITLPSRPTINAAPIYFGTSVHDSNIAGTTSTLSATAESGADLYIALRSQDNGDAASAADTNYTVLYSDHTFNGTSYAEVSYNAGTDNVYTADDSDTFGKILSLIPVYNASYSSYSLSSLNGQTPPAVSCNDGDLLLIAILNQDINPPVTVTPPTGYTLLFNEYAGAAAGNSAGIAVAYKYIDTTGTETPGAWTINDANATDVHYSVSIRLAPS